MRPPIKHRKPYDWDKAPIRQRKGEDGEDCATCRKDIKPDHYYIDGGNGNLAHPECVGQALRAMQFIVLTRSRIYRGTKRIQ